MAITLEAMVAAAKAVVPALPAEQAHAKVEAGAQGGLSMMGGFTAWSALKLPVVGQSL